MKHPASDWYALHRGQMTVEFAVVMPVLLAIGFIALQGLLFVGECVRFDTAFRSSVLLVADTAKDSEASAREVEEKLINEQGFTGDSVHVDVETQGLGHCRYTATFAYTPSMLADVEVFGARVPALQHTVFFVVSPYRRGVVT